MSKRNIDGSGTLGGDTEPLPQRYRHNFETAELNNFLHNGINQVEQHQLLMAIRKLKLPNADSDGVVELLSEVVQTGNLPQTIVQSAGDARSMSSTAPGSGRTNPPPIEPPAEFFTLDKFLETVEERVKGDKFSSLSIAHIGNYINTYIKKENEGIDRNVLNGITVNAGLIRITDENTQKEELVRFNADGTIKRERGFDALVQVGAIESKPIEKHMVKAALHEGVEGFMSAGSEEYIQYTPGLVTTEPPNPDLDIATNDCSRAEVLVLAGESGSGKSRFSVGAFVSAERDTPVLRYSLRVDDIDTYKSESEALLGDPSTRHLRKLTELVTVELFNKNLKEHEIYKSVRSVANHLNADRNKWALEMASTKVKVAVTNVGSEDLCRWYGNETEPAAVTLDNLVVVFDECGSSPDFVAGILATARDRFLPFLRDQKRLAKNIGLVLCGSGLEAIKTTGSNGNRYLGSDPAITNVVIMRTTKLEMLQDSQLRDAIENGTISRVLASNARMLTQGLIPALSNELVVSYINNDEEKHRRRVAFGSFRYAMDYCVRRYVHLNGLKSVDQHKRSRLLKNSFRFFIRSALTTLLDEGTAAAPCARRLLKEVSDADEGGDEDVFRIGLATRDPARTSNALKYLSCAGATEYLFFCEWICIRDRSRPAFGTVL
mmetsp:Transcript_48351/g.117087  ORF Transcript_48351/g.117087 Transcript_48351/m.117087 type:complete len:662 (-) Transcript_48351:2601-4586(-)